MWDKLSPRCTVCLNKFNTIEFSVYLAPPRRFICLLSSLSCGSVISGTCLRTRTVPDKTPAIGTHRGRGSDALPELAVSKDYLVVFELYRRSLTALRIDSHTDPCSQKKQHRVWLILRFISERQVYSAVRWMWGNAGIKLSNFLSFTEYKWQVWLTWPFLFYILLCKSYSSTFQCIAINLHFNISGLCSLLQGWQGLKRQSYTRSYRDF